MAEFCKCGSLIINGHCSNKSCAFTLQSNKSAAASPKKAKAKAKPSTTTKSRNPRAASKCITYNLYDLNNNDNNAQNE